MARAVRAGPAGRRYRPDRHGQRVDGRLHGHPERARSIIRPDSDENNVSFTLNYRVTDLDGDTADGTLNINVDDDTPEMNRADVSLPTLTVDETNLAANASGNVFGGFRWRLWRRRSWHNQLRSKHRQWHGQRPGRCRDRPACPAVQHRRQVVTGSTSATLAGVTAGNTVFTVSVNSGTGVVTLDQLRAVSHPMRPTRTIRSARPQLPSR